MTGAVGGGRFRGSARGQGRCREVRPGQADAPAGAGRGVEVLTWARAGRAIVRGVLEDVLPRPSGREVQCPASGGEGEPARDLQQPTVEGLGQEGARTAHAEHIDPARQVVREGRGDEPGGVGFEDPEGGSGSARRRA